MRRVLLIALVLFSINAQAQLDWWNQTHNWDGTTPWTQYMKYSHAYLGPNAIPIPTLHRSDRSYFRSSSQMSLIEEDSFLSIHNELHWDRGHTQFHITHQPPHTRRGCAYGCGVHVRARAYKHTHTHAHTHTHTHTHPRARAHTYACTHTW